MILLRATNESLQINTGNTVPTTYQFPSDSIATVGTIYNDAANLNIGFICAVTQTVTATGLRYYAPTTGISVTPTLYDDLTSTVLATGATFVTTAVGWVFLPFTASAPLSPGIDYIPTIFVVSGQYTSAPGTFPLNDGLVYNTQTDSARYTYGAATKPVTHSSVSAYGVDIVVTGPAAQTTAPVQKGYTYITNIAGQTLTVSPDATIANGDWMILVFTSYVGAGAVTDPPGWTVLQSITATGTLRTSIYAKNRVAGETSYSVTVAANGNSDNLTLVWGSGGAPIGNWILGTNLLRPNIVPTTTTNNVAPSINTTVINTLVLAVSTERNSTKESGIISMTGAIPWGFTPQANLSIQTVSIGTLIKQGIGATGDVTIVYPVAQVNNGMALQIGIPPSTGNLTYSVSYTESTASTAIKSSNEGTITSSSTTTMLSAPAASTTRLAKIMTIANTDPYVPTTLVVQKNSGGTTYNLSPTVTLLAGEVFQYMDKVGWTYFASNGTMKADTAVTSGTTANIQANKAGKLTGAIPKTTNEIWTSRTGSGSRAWTYRGVTISSDASKMLAVTQSSLIYNTVDSGVTWNSQASSRFWTGVTGSQDGTKYAAIASNALIQTSNDGGGTWVGQTGSGSRTWTSITGSSDGTKLAAINTGDNFVYTSTDSGVTWTQQANSNLGSWQAITSSANGSIIYGTKSGSTIYTSTDSGVTWASLSGSGSRSWTDIATSADGTKIAAIVSNSYIYRSNDSGATWNPLNSAGAGSWQCVAMSTDGTVMAATAYGNYIYISKDAGVSWIQQTSAGIANWFGIAMTPDGSKIIATIDGGYIYTYSTNTASPGLAWKTAYGPAKSHSLSFLTSNATIAMNAQTTNPTAPASGLLSLYTRSTATNNFPSLLDAANSPTSLQSAQSLRTSMTWTPGPTNVGTWVNTNGVTVGNASNVLPTTTNSYTAMRRSTFASTVTTTNQQVGIRSENMFLIGTMPSQGGFFFSCRFGFDAIATGMRAFVGFSPTTIIVSSDPSTVANILGFGFDLADSAWTFYHNGASGTATKDTISGQGTLATNNTGYDAYIYCPPNSTIVYYRLDRTDTGATIIDSSTNTNLPVNSTLLQATAQMSNGTANTTANAATLGINRLYVETIY